MKRYLISCEPDMATAWEYLQPKPQETSALGEMGRML